VTRILERALACDQRRASAAAPRSIFVPRPARGEERSLLIDGAARVKRDRGAGGAHCVRVRIAAGWMQERPCPSAVPPLASLAMLSSCSTSHIYRVANRGERGGRTMRRGKWQADMWIDDPFIAPIAVIRLIAPIARRARRERSSDSVSRPIASRPDAIRTRYYRGPLAIVCEENGRVNCRWLDES